MAIYGPLGLRTMEFSGGVWRSPSHRQFVWDNPVKWATCFLCPKDKDDHVIIRRECECGIHATLWPDEFVRYMRTDSAVGFVVEALGSAKETEDLAQIWMHDYGFTASGVQIVGIVNWTKMGELIQWKITSKEITMLMGKQKLAQQLAGVQFGVNIWPIKTVVEMLRIQWEKNGEPWPLAIANAWAPILG